MKKILLETSFSKIYMIVMIIITLLILGGYFSYAIFTVSKEKSNAISIVTGNLTYELLIDGEEGNTLTVPSNTVKDFTITLSNPNNRIARFNFYYIGDLPSNTKVGYIAEDGTNTLPDEKGINLEKSGTVGSSNTYTIRVINNSGSSVTVNLGVSVGLDYNDLSLPDNGHLFEEITYKGEVGTVVLSNISKDNIYDDGVDTFTTGQYPNNYVWYSGKLWRAVSANNEEKTVKLVTQWDISAISFDNDSSSFEESYMEEWLNDTTVDGFLYNLREPEKFIVTDAVWDATIDDRELGKITRPSGETTVTDAIGLLNMYEYQCGSSYLNNGLIWWTLTPYSASKVRIVLQSGIMSTALPSNGNGIRPSINLKSNVKIVDGNGTKDNPYRLEGDNDNSLSDISLNTRYSGEYIRFGNDENNLYRIISHETDGLTKITCDKSLKENGKYKALSFGDTLYYSKTNTIGTFLNGEYLTDYIGDYYSKMIEDSTIWYLGPVGTGESYKLAKYTDINMSGLTSNTTTTKIGLLRYGELMANHFTPAYSNNPYYCLLTPNIDVYNVWGVYGQGNLHSAAHDASFNVRPSFNLKSNVIITEGDGTLQNPFEIALATDSSN